MIVVDANVAIKWIVEQPHYEHAREIVAKGTFLMAPGMFVSEVTSTLWSYTRNRTITVDQAQNGLALILGQISLFEQDASLAEEALTKGSELNYAPYDCFYLVLAVRRAVPFVTADKRFINRIANTPYRSHVVHLTDWT